MTTISLNGQEVDKEEIVERNPVTYMLENRAHLTILKESKGDVYRNVINVAHENTTREQRINGNISRYRFVGEWFPKKLTIFTKKKIKRQTIKNLKSICEESELKIEEVMDFQ